MLMTTGLGAQQPSEMQSYVCGAFSIASMHTPMISNGVSIATLMATWRGAYRLSEVQFRICSACGGTGAHARLISSAISIAPPSEHCTTCKGGKDVWRAAWTEMREGMRTRVLSV